MVSPVLQLLKVATIGAMAVLIALGGRAFFDYYKDREADPLLGRPYILSVSEDDDGDTIAKRLHDDDMIRSELYFTTALRLSGRDLSPDTYTLRHGYSVMDIIEVIAIKTEDEGDDDEDSNSAAISVESVTFPEGRRITEMADIVQESDLPFDGQDFLDAVERVDRDRYDFLSDVPDDVSLEGYLFPATYDVGSDWSADDLVSIMLGKFDEELAPTMRERADEMGLSIHEVITLASIVEREAAVADERPTIASVYMNRMDPNAETVGLLGADPTVQYVLGNEDDWWPELQPNQATEDPDADSPYNTYLYPGLPPGPITNPGADAIRAVLSPADTNYLYFVAKDDGSDTHAFASTYSEQLANECEFIGGSACGG